MTITLDRPRIPGETEDMAPSLRWIIRHSFIKLAGESMGQNISPNANVKLLDATLDAVRHEANKGSDGEWRQGVWRCESGMCFAGYAAHLAGARWSVELTPEELARDENLFRGDLVNVITPDGRDMPVWAFAEEALGLSEWDSHALFDAVNDLDDIEQIITTIKDRAGAGK